jgi:hypothetical protein
MISWSDVARVCRRVCILRERGQHEEAERLRAGSLLDMVSKLRTSIDSETTVTERLDAIFAVEVERVANAAALAEILVPLLAEQLRPLAGAPSLAPTPVPEISRPAKPAAPRTPASIADFIDDMIAQESPPDRPGGAQRRAS